jgi:hypothetical protein
MNPTLPIPIGGRVLEKCVKEVDAYNGVFGESF